MKRLIAFLMIFVFVLSLVGCKNTQPQIEVHKIGVVVYSITDDQVAAFKEYLVQYIGESFQDVEFIYSQSITSKEDELDFIQTCIDAGAEGIMAFNSYDLNAEVSLCADNGVYYIRPSATIAEADFEKVEDNPYFIGYFGPGSDMEYQAGADMAAWFAAQNYGNEYYIFSGGATLGNSMHIQRTLGMLDALTAAYGVSFDLSNEEIATAQESATYEAGDLKVTVFGGYIAREPYYTDAKTVYEANPCKIILGAIPLGKLVEEFEGCKVGVIDCYSQTNSNLFESGTLQYVCGKFSSIIGPAFAAMYNAVTGHADEFREDGKAFKITQGFWVSENADDYQKKFELSKGIALNAYSIDDILSIVKEANESATLDDLKALAQAWDYDSARARRE